MKEIRRDAADTLRRSWSERGQDLPRAVKSLHDFQARYEAPISLTAGLLDASPALVYVHLALYALPSEVVQLIAQRRTPPSTWLALARLSEPQQRQAIEEIARLPSGSRPLNVVKAMFEVRTAQRSDLVQEVPGKVFMHLSRKAKDYHALNEKGRHALNDFGKKIARKSKLNENQVSYLAGMLGRLDEAGVLDKACQFGKDCDLCRMARELNERIQPNR